jgi:ABC-type glycerol-3-phosphate transport system substrate-binding protein
MLWVGKSYQGEKEQVELSLIRPMTAEEAAAQAAEQSESTTMTVGGLSFLIDGMVREAVVDFNKNNEDCQIEIVEYGAEDIQAGVVQLNADIVAGNAPDVMLLPIGYSLDSYIGLGVLEDMYPYLLQDETVSMADLQENVLRAYETDGQLFGLPISYQIVTLMGQGSLLDGRTSWTMEELMDFTARHQANSTIFDNSTQAGVLHICLVGSGQQLIDPASGALDRELMIQMLEYAKPFTPDAEYNGGMNEEQIMERASDGRIFLFNTQVNSPHNYQMYSTLYGEPISYVGYPGAAGSGTLVDSNMLFGINSNSELKAEAWDFISSMLTEKVQDSPMMFNIPVRRSVMETRLERAMEENSNGLLSYGTIQMEMLPVGEKEAQMYRDLIDSVDRRADFDEQIERIIAEESAGYFSGDRTALEATDVIENRVGTYLAESR